MTRFLLIFKLVFEPMKPKISEFQTQQLVNFTKLFHSNWNLKELLLFWQLFTRQKALACFHNQRRRMLIYWKIFSACFQNILETDQIFQTQTFIKWNIYPSSSILYFTLTYALCLVTIFIDLILLRIPNSIWTKGTRIIHNSNDLLYFCI